MLQISHTIEILREEDSIHFLQFNHGNIFDYLNVSPKFNLCD